MSSVILTEFKRIVKDQTGKELQQRKTDIKQFGTSLLHNFVGARLFFEHNIVEVRFDRKLPAKFDEGQVRTRRMICTRDFFFAQRFAKHFGERDVPCRPKHKRQLNWYRSKNLILVFDLIELQYRMVHLKKWTIMDFIPLSKENAAIINEFTKKINPRRISESSKKAFYRK